MKKLLYQLNKVLIFIFRKEMELSMQNYIINDLVKKLIELQTKVSFALERIETRAELSYFDVFYIKFVLEKETLNENAKIFFKDYFSKKIDFKYLEAIGLIEVEKLQIRITKKGIYLMKEIPFPESVKNLYHLPDNENEFILVTEMIETIDNLIA